MAFVKANGGSVPELPVFATGVTVLLALGVASGVGLLGAVLGDDDALLFGAVLAACRRSRRVAARHLHRAGSVRPPNLPLAFRLAAAVGCTIEDLLRPDGPAKPG